MTLQYGQTLLHPFAIAITLLSCLLIISLPRRYAILPLVFAGVFISFQQRIVVAGADFTMLRILVISGLFRLFIKSEYKGLELNIIDKCMLYWGISKIITYTFLWMSFGAFLNRVGGSLSSLGIYFFLRGVIRDFDDIKLLLAAFIIISVPIATAMAIEWLTGKNLFYLFGGVPEFTHIRGGRLRCQGPFQHSILAGSFGASLFTISLSYWWQKGRGKTLMILGGLSSIIMTATSSSSGPVLTFMVGLLGMFMWPFREKMRIIQYAVGLSLIGLHFVMKAPVWALIARVKVFGSSTGYHRYLLIDEFIKRFKEWWLFGVKSTENWGHEGMNLWDVTNHYIRTAVDGGLSTLVLLIVIIILCFRSLGRALRVSDEKQMKIFLWALGASFFSHIVSFMSVSYFDQIVVLWYSLLCVMSTIYDLTNDDYINRFNAKLIRSTS